MSDKRLANIAIRKLAEYINKFSMPLGQALAQVAKDFDELSALEQQQVHEALVAHTASLFCEKCVELGWDEDPENLGEAFATWCDFNAVDPDTADHVADLLETAAVYEEYGPPEDEEAPRLSETVVHASPLQRGLCEFVDDDDEEGRTAADAAVAKAGAET